MPKYYWIKERHNPQFKNPYYVCYGNITVKKAKKMENPIYGDNYMHKFSTKEAYETKIKSLKEQGEDVHNSLFLHNKALNLTADKAPASS